MALFGPLITPACTGNDGSATASVDSSIPAHGLLAGVVVKYAGDKPASTDVTVKTKGTSPAAPSYNLIVLTDANTDGYFPVRKQTKDTAGADIAGQYDLMVVDDLITVSVAQANTGDVITVWLLLV